MKKVIFLTSVLVAILFISRDLSFGQLQGHKSENVGFCGIRIPTKKPIVPIGRTDRISDDWIAEMISKIDDTKANHELVKEIRKSMKAMSLPNWVLLSVLNQLSSGFDPPARILFKFFVIRQMGFDVKLYFNPTHLFLLVRSNQKSYGLKYVELENDVYIIIDGLPGEIDYCVAYEAKEKCRRNAFSMLTKKTPTFQEKSITQKEVSFSYGGPHGMDESISLTFKLDRSWLCLLDSAPQLEFSELLRYPISQTFRSSIQTQFRDLLSEKNEVDAANILLNFCAKGFRYEEDFDQFGEEKFFLPEQTIFADASDCEDRSLLFALLVKELLGHQVILLLYPDHLISAIDLKNDVGETIDYNGNTYTVCDPTVISLGKIKVGTLAQEYQNRPFVIID